MERRKILVNEDAFMKNNENIILTLLLFLKI